MTNKTANFSAGVAKMLRSTNLGPVDSSREVSQEEHFIVIDLDDLEEEEGDYNPRLTENEKYESIKASIKERGIDQPVRVTQRPGSKKFIRKAGGKTRCAALRELYRETGDYDRYGRLETLFSPFVSETDIMIGHATENLLRAGLNFYEQAVQERNIFESICNDDPGFRNASLSDRQKRYESEGLRIDRTYLHSFDYIFSTLHPDMKRQLVSGMQIRTIKSIRSLETRVLTAIGKLDQTKVDEFREVFRRTVLRHGEAGDTLDFDLFETELLRDASKLVGMEPGDLLKTTSETEPAADSQVNPETPSGRNTARLSNDSKSDKNPFNYVPTNNPKTRNAESKPAIPVEDVQGVIESIRKDALDSATSLAMEHGLMEGSFFTLENIALGYGLENPDHLSLLEKNRGLESLCVFLQMHSLFWSVLQIEIAKGKVADNAISELSQGTSPKAIVASQTYTQMPHNDMYGCLNMMRLKSVAERSTGGVPRYTTTVSNLDNLTKLAVDYVQLLEK